MNSNYDVVSMENFLKNIAQEYGSEVLSKKDIEGFAKKHNLPYPKFAFSNERKVAWGKYSVSMVVNSVVPLKKNKAENNMKLPDSIRADISCSVPKKDPTFVPFGNYSDIETIIKSKVFFPVYLTGLSGNGKTMSIMQACAKHNREMLRINVTEETDEIDLLGGTELINGSTVYREGAVLLAMRTGAVLLIDEGDLNNTKILCLMPILEGKPYLNKKTGEVITPAAGFNIFITGNTKGKGSDDGRFIGTKIMNEAFLERFAVTLEQDYPTSNIEKKILLRNMEDLECVDDDFATKLCTWADITRKTFKEGGIDEVITTRRLVHIIKTFSIFKDRSKAVSMALNRFDNITKVSFFDLYTKIDESTSAQQQETAAPVEAPPVQEEVPF